MRFLKGGLNHFDFSQFPFPEIEGYELEGEFEVELLVLEVVLVEIQVLFHFFLLQDWFVLLKDELLIVLEL